MAKCSTWLAVLSICGVCHAPALVRAQSDVPDPEMGFLPPEEDIPTSDEDTPPAQERGEQPSQRKQRADGAGRGRSGGDRPERKGGGARGQQTQVLAPGVLRIEAGPPDFALLDSGMVGEGRGLRIGRADIPGGGVYAGLGLGVSLGIIENLEVGILQLPLIMDNGAGETDFGNIELHGRYGVVTGGPVELAVQLVMQLPTNRWLGWGLGLPLRIFATDEWILDTGLELEVVTLFEDNNSGTWLNLDFPVAVNYFFMPEAFVGLRSGMFVWDFREVYIPAGVQGGYAFADGMVRMMGWFQWAAIPLGQFRYDADTVFDAGSFEFGVGANIFLGYRKGGG